MKLILKEDLLYTGGCLLCKAYEDRAEIDPRYTRDPDVDVLTVEGERTLTIPEGVEAIEADAFSECPKLEEVTLPQTLNAMESTALRNLWAVRVSPHNRRYRMESGFLVERREDGDRLLWVPEKQEIVKIPNSVSRIAPGMFQYNFHLRALYVSANMEEIGVREFRSCKHLQRVFLSEKLRVVAKDAFLDCASLKMVVMANPMTFLTHDMKGEREEGDAFEGVNGFHLFSDENLWMTHYLDRHRCIRHPLAQAQVVRDLDNGPRQDREERIRRYLECL